MPVDTNYLLFIVYTPSILLKLANIVCKTNTTSHNVLKLIRASMTFAILQHGNMTS